MAIVLEEELRASLSNAAGELTAIIARIESDAKTWELQSHPLDVIGLKINDFMDRLNNGLINMNNITGQVRDLRKFQNEDGIREALQVTVRARTLAQRLRAISVERRALTSKLNGLTSPL